MTATTVDQIADRSHRISTCLPDVAPGGLTFKHLVDAEELLLAHTGMRRIPAQALPGHDAPVEVGR